MTERITTPQEFDTSDGPQSQPAPAPAYMSELGAEPDGRRPAEVLARIAELEAELQAARTELGRVRKPKGGLPWRTGRKVSRTIYDRDDALIGVMDTAELAAMAVVGYSDYSLKAETRIAELEAKLAEAVDLCERGALAGQILEALRGQ